MLSVPTKHEVEQALVQSLTRDQVATPGWWKAAFPTGSACFFIKITSQAGLKVFHSEHLNSDANRARGLFFLAQHNREMQEAFYREGLAPEPGRDVHLHLFDGWYNGFWTEIAEPISQEKFELTLPRYESRLAQMGIRDLDRHNAGLINGRFVVIDFSVVEDGNRYLGYFDCAEAFCGGSPRTA